MASADRRMDIESSLCWQQSPTPTSRPSRFPRFFLTYPAPSCKIAGMTSPSLALDIVRPLIHALESREWAKNCRAAESYRLGRRQAADWLRMARNRCSSSDERRALSALWRTI